MFDSHALLKLLEYCVNAQFISYSFSGLIHGHFSENTSFRDTKYCRLRGMAMPPRLPLDPHLSAAPYISSPVFDPLCELPFRVTNVSRDLSYSA